MNTEQERTEFEAWYRLHHGSRDVYGRDASGEYADKQVQGAFNVWQARAALTAQPAAATKAPGDEGASMTDHWCKYCNGMNTHNCQFNPNLPRMTTHAAVCWSWGPKHYECVVREIERLRAEVERLSSYYKNGIDCFANPCERHSGERTPPFAEFFEKYGGQCLICVVDNNKALQAENERLAEVERLQEAVRPRREDECLTLDHWRIRAYHLEENWSRCSRACAIEQDKREQAEARTKQLADALRELEEREQRDEALLRQALEADNEMLRKVLKEAYNELDWLDEEVDTCDHSVGVCMCSYWSIRRKMKAALSKENGND